jgi:lysophospholipase L1-like esterase
MVFTGMTLLQTGCIDDLLGSDSKKLGDGHDFGDNNPDLVLCMGDSITAGGFSGAAPWPSRFGNMIGKSVINDGIPGVQSDTGATRIRTLLDARKPGFVIIFYGANDALVGRPPEQTAGFIRSMVRAAKDASTIPVVATALPMAGERSIYNERVDAINREIRSVASQEGAKLVNTHGAVKRNTSLYLVDGLHLSSPGEELVAMEFNDAFR